MPNFDDLGSNGTQPARRKRRREQTQGLWKFHLPGKRSNTASSKRETAVPTSVPTPTDGTTETKFIPDFSPEPTASNSGDTNLEFGFKAEATPTEDSPLTGEIDPTDSGISELTNPGPAPIGSTDTPTEPSSPTQPPLKNRRKQVLVGGIAVAVVSVFTLVGLGVWANHFRLPGTAITEMPRAIAQVDFSSAAKGAPLNDGLIPFVKADNLIAMVQQGPENRNPVLLAVSISEKKLKWRSALPTSSQTNCERLPSHPNQLFCLSDEQILSRVNIETGQVSAGELLPARSRLVVNQGRLLATSFRNPPFVIDPESLTYELTENSLPLGKIPDAPEGCAYLDTYSRVDGFGRSAAALYGATAVYSPSAGSSEEAPKPLAEGFGAYLPLDENHFILGYPKCSQTLYTATGEGYRAAEITAGNPVVWRPSHSVPDPSWPIWNSPTGEEGAAPAPAWAVNESKLVHINEDGSAGDVVNNEIEFQSNRPVVGSAVWTANFEFTRGWKISPFNQRVMVISDGSKVWGLSEDGTILWNRNGSYLEVQDSVAYLTKGVEVVGVNIRNGEELWHRPAFAQPAQLRLAVDQQRVIEYDTNRVYVFTTNPSDSGIETISTPPGAVGALTLEDGPEETPINKAAYASALFGADQCFVMPVAQECQSDRSGCLNFGPIPASCENPQAKQFLKLVSAEEYASEVVSTPEQIQSWSEVCPEGDSLRMPRVVRDLGFNMGCVK